MGLLSFFYGGDELQKEGDALDAKLRKSNEELYGPGGKFYNAGDWKQIEQNMSTGSTGDVSAQLNDAFISGLEDGKKNITGAVAGTFDLAGGGLGAVLKGIPWYVWAGVLVFFLWPVIGRKLARA